MACALLDSGIVKGDRVGTWAINCPEWVFTQDATARIGAIMVNINPAYRTHEVEYVLRQSGVRLLIASPGHKTSDYRAMAEDVRGRCPELREVVYIGDPTWDALIARATPDPAYPELSCDDPVTPVTCRAEEWKALHLLIRGEWAGPAPGPSTRTTKSRSRAGLIIILTAWRASRRCAAVRGACRRAATGRGRGRPPRRGSAAALG